MKPFLPENEIDSRIDRSAVLFRREEQLYKLLAGGGSNPARFRHRLVAAADPRRRRKSRDGFALLMAPAKKR
jgi:hypothetical protein